MNADMKIDRATICHPNARGTGSAVRLALYPAHERTAGHIMLELARQKTTASANGATPVFATFDWENPIVAKLGLSELSQMIMVFRGMQESIEDGKGIFHRSATANSIIKFSHMIEPRPCYALEISRKPFDGELESVTFAIRPEEAVWLCAAIEASMGILVFGVPSVNA